MLYVVRKEVKNLCVKVSTPANVPWHECQDQNKLIETENIYGKKEGTGCLSSNVFLFK